MRKMIGALVVLLAGVVLIGSKTINTVERNKDLTTRKEESTAEAAAKFGSQYSAQGIGDQDGSVVIADGIHYQILQWDEKQEKGKARVIGAKGLKNIKIPQQVVDEEGRSLKVTGIASGAFQNEPGIVSIHIPKTVQKIGKNVFAGAGKLKKITIAKSNKNYKVVDNTLYTKSGKTLIAVVDTGVSYLIPKGVTKIRAGALVYCKNLKTLKIPATIKQIGVLLDGTAPALRQIEFYGKEVPRMVPSEFSTDIVSQHKKLTVVVPKKTKAAYRKALGKIMGNLEGLTIKADPNTDKPKVYLTFDDGPSSNTKDILKILKKYNVHATFFVLGKKDAVSKKLYQQIVEEGHSLGVHSTTHNYRKVYASEKSFEEDFATTRDILWKVTGIKPTLYRFPGGSNNGFGSKKERAKNIAYIKSQGAVHYDWTACNDDSIGKNYSSSQLVNNALRGVNKNRENIILMHDAPAKKNTVRSLAKLIEILQQRGFAMVAMDEYVEQVAFTK